MSADEESRPPVKGLIRHFIASGNPILRPCREDFKSRQKCASKGGQFQEARIWSNGAAVRLLRLAGQNADGAVGVLAMDDANAGADPYA